MLDSKTMLLMYAGLAMGAFANLMSMWVLGVAPGNVVAVIVCIAFGFLLGHLNKPR